uniref:Kinase non-catalytic C-lobe domain containing 1 n=1 Tax=Theropithecus gelada TaxID=9565 RepID=A0A8D2GLW1_THEGE
MQAMDPAAADLYEEDGKDLDFYDFEPLPTLPEDEENVSLADILSLRDRGLSEQEAWAVCLECSLSMRSVAHAAIFQSLCITPDTLAFNTSGNVCFMEQLSDDPEGAFIPPEFDVTGNTFEVSAATQEAEVAVSRDYTSALHPEQQSETPPLKKRLTGLISGGRGGRRGAGGRPAVTTSCLCPDVSESSWRERPVPGNAGPRRPPGDPSADPEVLPAPKGPVSEASRGPRTSPTKALLSTPVRNGESHSREELASLVLDAERTLGDLDRDALRRSHLRKVQTFPRLPSDSPEASPCLPLTRGKSQLPMSELFPPDPRKAFLDRKNGLSSFQAQPKCRLWPEQELEHQLGGVPCAGRSADRGPGVPGSPGQPETSHPSPGPAEAGPPACPAHPRDASGEAQTPGDDERIPEGARPPESAAAEQWVSLQDLLSQLGRPFREYELWALCLACLRALQMHPEHPAYLCLDSVLVAEDGAVLFQPPPANGSYDSFFLAPELAEERLVTEKASVYCVAAVLWTAAKFSVPCNHKLALPRRLKTLLLDMARRSAPERPSAAEAIKVCGSYLLQRGMDSRKILAHLRASTCQVYQEEETISLQNAFSVVELKPSVAPAPEPSPGFLPVNSDTRLVAVPGPVPSQRPCCEEATQLPAAFTSEATHFKPIVLAQNTVMARDQPALAQERGSQREGDGEKLSAEALAGSPSLKTPDGPAPGPGSQGAAPEPPGESAQRDPAQGCPCPPPRAPANQPEEASSAAPSSPVPAPPMKASALPERPGPSGQAPPGVTSGGLRPDTLGPTTAHHGPRHPPKPPRSKATEHPGQDPEGPRATPAGERDDQSPDSVTERPRPADRRPCLPGVDASPLPGRTACPSLQEATRLIQEEFAFDGYLDNGLEALIMGEYILALKDLTFATFCGAISEKFCDLYWDEKLLQNLFRVVNGQASPSPSTAEDAESQLESSRSPRSPSSRRPSLHPLGKEKPAMARTSSRTLVSDVDSEALSRGNFEVGFRPQRSVKAERAQQPEVGEDRRPAGGASDAEAVTRLARSKGGGPAVSPGPAGFQSCSPGWCSAFYEADCFGADVHNYVKDLGRQQVDGALPDAQSPEEAVVSRDRATALQPGQRAKVCPKKKKALVLEVVGNCYPCPPFNFSGDSPDSDTQRERTHTRHHTPRTLAEPWGEATRLPHCHPVLSHSDAFLEGYVQQFLYTFRYFCTPQDFLHFLLDRINSTLTRAHQDPTSTFTKIYRRSLCVLQAWVEDCYTVDFTRNSGLLGKLEDFISSKILPLDGSAKHLLGLLEVGMDRRAEGSPRSTDLENPREAEEDARPFNALCKRLSEDGISRKSFPWRLPRGNGLVLPPHKERPYTIAAALPKPCFLEDFYGPCAKTSEKGPYFLTEYSTHQLFSQLTLLQQELFQKCHPVHFLNSRALGVMDKSTAIPKASSSESLSAKTCSLFLPNYVQDKYLLQLLRNADDVSTWVAAEIVTSHTSKLQVNLLSKFLLIAKSCYEQRNFATAMQILSGLEHLAVRQSPAWRILPAKIAEVMEELKAVEVFLKSDSLCLMEGRRFRAQPTLPSAHLLAMHIQQLETGGFTMTNGAHRWSKLRNIAKVVSQVHAFQENPYTFSPDPKLQSYLKQRIARFSGADISTLAADSRANFHQVSSEKHSRKIQDKLRRMKATFQ